MSDFNIQALIGIVLALAALLASARLLYRHTQRDRAQPPRHVRLAFLLLLQPPLAALLYLGLFPPQQSTDDTVMTVFTSAAQVSHASGKLRIALPEAADEIEAEAVPDLATALRRHPQVERLHVVGAGLEPRDLDAARRYPLTFDRAAPPSGLVELDAPSQVGTGGAFTLRGRIAGLSGATVELLDPSGQRVQQIATGADGRFALQGAMRAAGLTMFSLRVRDASDKESETLPLPIRVVAPPSLRVLALAGAPSPELKYLRRWAIDAGITLHTRTGVGAGLVLGDAPIAIDLDTLRRFDAVLLDEPSLRTLTGGELRALDAAVREGLGMLLRIDGPLSATEQSRLRGWGFEVDAGADTTETRLPKAGSDAPLPPLTRRALRVQAPDAVPLLRDAQGQPLAFWHAQGRGRIALMLLPDSFKLTLSGHGDRHAELWSTMLASIARTESAPPLPIPPWPVWQGERAALCGLADRAEVIAPDGARIPLSVDPATAARRCAAFWPQQSGWQQLRVGDAQIPFAVLPATAGVAWQMQRRLDATAALTAAASSPAHAGESRRSPAWLWLAAWLTLTALSWALERWWR